MAPHSAFTSHGFRRHTWLASSSSIQLCRLLIPLSCVGNCGAGGYHHRSARNIYARKSSTPPTITTHQSRRRELFPSPPRTSRTPIRPYLYVFIPSFSENLSDSGSFYHQTQHWPRSVPLKLGVCLLFARENEESARKRESKLYIYNTKLPSSSAILPTFRNHDGHDGYQELQAQSLDVWHPTPRISPGRHSDRHLSRIRVKDPKESGAYLPVLILLVARKSGLNYQHPLGQSSSTSCSA